MTLLSIVQNAADILAVTRPSSAVTANDTTARVLLVCAQREGKALSAGYVRRLLPALARIAGIHKRVHAHGLRHTHAAQLREEGLDVGIISKQLGHRSILTTIRYLFLRSVLEIHEGHVHLVYGFAGSQGDCSPGFPRHPTSHEDTCHAT
jgi:site-specific recombinase XerD